MAGPMAWAIPLPLLLLSLLCSLSFAPGASSETLHTPVEEASGKVAGASTATPQLSHFEEHMRGLLQVTDHQQLKASIHEASLKAQRAAESVAAAGTGTSEYLDWRLGSNRRRLGQEGGSPVETSTGDGMTGGRARARGRGRGLAVANGTGNGNGNGNGNAIQSPGLNAAPTSADMNITVIRFGSVSYPALVDWRASPALDTGIQDQKSCESCWVLTMTDIIAMTWSLSSRFLAPVPVSAQQVCDCAFPKCCSGGWPEWTLAFTKLNQGLAPQVAYPYLGKDGQKCRSVDKTQLTGKITGWEKLPASSRDALIKTVAQHPVVVMLYASNSFMMYRGGIFTGSDCPKKASVNHAVVVMGFNASGAQPYWIVKNSWGPGWGEGGYMRLSMSSNICGFGNEPSLYPTMYHVATPCDALPSPCGTGTCYLMSNSQTARCLCPSGFVEKLEATAPKCVSANPCGAAVNPCSFGTCNNEFDGSYTCTCPPGTIIGSGASGGETCIVNSFQSGLETYTSVPGDDCPTLMWLFSLSLSTLITMNPFLNCIDSIIPGTIIVVQGAETGLGCSSRDAVTPNDTCTSIAIRNAISVPQLVSYNKGLICGNNGVSNLRVSQHLCVMPGELALSSPFERSCGNAEDVEEGDTCLDVTSEYNVSLAILDWLNPGIDCSQPLPATSVCTAPLLLGMTTVTCSGYYNVTHGDTCFTVADGANMDIADFLAINPGLRCKKPYWNIGRSVCVNGSSVPLDTVTAEPNMQPYYVKVNDTLDSIAQSFQGQCDNAGDPGNGNSLSQFKEDICWANSWMPDCSDRKVIVGSMLLIPCQKDIGAVSCSSSSATDSSLTYTCGNNYVTYATYSCASIAFATPPISGSSPCKTCDQYCIAIGGTTMSSFWGTLPTGCSDRTCPFPAMPTAAMASNWCMGTTAACQYHQVQCSAAVASLSVGSSPVSSSVGCQKFKACMAGGGCGQPYVRNPCGQSSYAMAICGLSY